MRCKVRVSRLSFRSYDYGLNHLDQKTKIFVSHQTVYLTHFMPLISFYNP